jgi:hypothetical protein
MSRSEIKTTDDLKGRGPELDDGYEAEMERATREFEQKVRIHPATNDCPDMECAYCAARDCPFRDMFHYHHDGCPSCLTAT